MTQKKIQLGILFFTLFIDMLGVGIVMPLLPRYGETLGAAPWQIGALVGIFSLAQLVVLPFWGDLSDRIGRKPVLVISVFGTFLGYLIMGLTRSIFIIMLGRAIDGIAGGNMSTIQASVIDVTDTAERPRMIGALGAAYGLGFIFGPALGGWASHSYGLAMPMLLAAGLAALNLLLILIGLSETVAHKKKKKRESMSLLLLLKHVEKKVYFPTLMTFFFFVCGFSMIITLLALFFYHRYGLNEFKVGTIYAMFGMVAIILEGGFFAFLARFLGVRLLASLGALCLAGAAFFMPLTTTLLFAVALCVLLAVGDSLVTPSLPVLVSESTHEQWQGAAFGCYQSVGCLARCFGPLLAGILLKMNDASWPVHYAQIAFWVASGLLFLALFSSLRIPAKNEIKLPHEYDLV